MSDGSSSPFLQTWVTVTSLELASPDRTAIAGYAIDSPRAGDRVRGPGLEINGWVIGREGPVRSVRLVRDGKSGPTVALDVLRPDVARDYPDFSHAETSGFSLWAPIEPDEVGTTLTVEATLANGKTVVLGRIVARIALDEMVALAGTRQVTAPDFVILGTQRGGTTSLHAYLGAHPRITLPTTKELHYLTDRHERGLEWYLGQFPPDIPQEHITGEATPYALFHPAAPDRLLAIAPRARLIVLLRNPVDRAYSHYLMERARGDESLDFAAAIAAEPARLAGEEARIVADPTYVSWPHKHQSYLSRGDYAPQVSRWLARFPREQFLFLRSEDLYRQTEATVAHVTEFLGLDPISGLSFPVHNRTDGPSLDPELRQRLLAGFAPKIADLAKLVHCDPSWTR